MGHKWRLNVSESEINLCDPLATSVIATKRQRWRKIQRICQTDIRLNSLMQTHSWHVENLTIPSNNLPSDLSALHAEGK